MIIKIKKPRFRSKIACFDYDWTLVCPKDGRTFPKNVDDWQWLRESIPETIKEFYKKGFGVYIFTNQSKEWKRDQIVNVLTCLDIPLTICIAYEKIHYKPSLALFNEAFTKAQQDKIKKKPSFFVGDALGRPNDHSDSDLKFAKAMGLECSPPEDIFKAKPATKIQVTPSKTQEVVIMVGYPGSGKSTICEKVFEPAGYFIAHGDILKTSAKMIKEAKKYVSQGKSVVFDATNPSKEKRAEYVNFAKEYKLPVRCILMTTSLEESLARNNKREKPIPKIVFNIYKKKYEEPSDSEGFKIIKI
jgi:bifunctional polynucleotide phosphatase/kinase